MSTNKSIGSYIANSTDKYFSRTKEIIKQNGDQNVIYTYFLRSNSIYAPLYVLSFLKQVQQETSITFKLHTKYKEQDIIPANTPIWFLEGSFKYLCELETLILQKVGFPFVVAYNAYLMAKTLKKVQFVSMGARHCPTNEVASIIDYSISIGSKKATGEGAKGFIGSSTNSGSKFFNQTEGLGTMPHSLIGYAGSTLSAAKLFRDRFPNQPLIVLVDYFGKELVDSLEVCNYFKDLAVQGNIGIRLDTHGSRYLQNLDKEKSWKVINKYVKKSTIDKLQASEIKYAIGKGVSAAAIFKLKETLVDAGYPLVKIVVSSGFNIDKCKVMAKLNVPVDIIGTGSLIPDDFTKTYATADIISYNDTMLVKKGRESLINYWKKFTNIY